MTKKEMIVIGLIGLGIAKIIKNQHTIDWHIYECQRGYGGMSYKDTLEENTLRRKIEKKIDNWYYNRTKKESE